MLVLRFLLAGLCLVSCIEKKETKIINHLPQGTPQDTPRSDNPTLIPQDFTDLEFSRIAQVPSDIINLSKKDSIPYDVDYETFLVTELNRFQCGLDQEYRSTSCVLPENIGELDYLWELAREMEMFALNNKLYLRDRNDKIQRIGSGIMRDVEAVQLYKDFQSDNVRIKKKIMENFGYSLSQVVTNGAIRMRVGLITLLELKNNPSFMNYVQQKNVITIFIHQTGTFSMSQDSLLLGWNLTVNEVTGKL